MTFPGSSFYGVQFHPELWRQSDNLVRVRHYNKGYGLSEKDLDGERFQDAPHSRNILTNFVDVVRNNNS